MKSFSRMLASLMALCLILTLLFTCLPFSSARAEGELPVGGILPPSFATEKTIRDESGPFGGRYVRMMTCGGSITSRNLNAVVLDEVTGEPVSGAGVYLYTPSKLFEFECTGDTTANDHVANLPDIPINWIPSVISDMIPSERMHFGIGSVPRNYKHPKNAELLMDIYVDTPVYDEIKESLVDDEGWPDWIAEIAVDVIKYGSSALDAFLPIPVSWIQDLIADTYMPRKFIKQEPDSGTGKLLPADIRYKDYSFLQPHDTIYWIRTELERKYCDPVTIIVPARLLEHTLTLNGPTGQIDYTLKKISDDEYALVTNGGLPLGSYYLEETLGPAWSRNYSFELTGIAFPTTANGSPDYQGFLNMTPLEQEILRRNDRDWYQEYYAADPGEKGKRKYNPYDNDWTMVTVLDFDGSLTVDNPYAVEGHVLRIGEPSEKMWLTKTWYGEAPADDEEITLSIFKNNWADQKSYLTSSLNDVSSVEYKTVNEQLMPRNGQPTYDENGHTLVYLSADRVNTVHTEDGLTIWEAPVYLPKSFIENSVKSFGVEEVSGPDGWVWTGGSGVRQDLDLKQTPSLMINNIQQPVQLQFYKVDMNGDPLPAEELPTFELAENISSEITALSTVRYPVPHDDSGLYSLNLHKNATYTLNEYNIGLRYKKDAVWSVTVSEPGDITIVPQNEAAGEVIDGGDGTFRLVNLFRKPQLYHLTKHWIDMAGTPIDPPDSVDGVKIHVTIKNRDDGTIFKSFDKTVLRKDDWKLTWYDNFESAYQWKPIDVIVSECEWLDENGGTLPVASGWKVTYPAYTASLNEQNTDISLDVRNVYSTAGMRKIDGAVLSTDYRFVCEWNNQTLVWDEETQCYPLDLTGDSQNGYWLDEYDKNGTLIGQWQLTVFNGCITGATAKGFTYDISTQNAPQAKIATDENGRKLLMLYNPVDVYQVKVRKEWDPSFIVYAESGPQIDHRAERITITLTPIGTGHSLEDMKPLPEGVMLPSVSVTMDRGTPGNNPQKTVQLTQNVIYVVSETDTHDEQKFSSRPFYRVSDPDGTVKNEWTLYNGVTVPSSDGAIVTEEDTDGTAIVYNNHGTFQVNLHVSDNYGSCKPSGAYVVLQKKIDCVWTDVDNQDVSLLKESSGLFLQNVSCLFENVDVKGEYRARLQAKNEEGIYTNVPDDTELYVWDDYSSIRTTSKEGGTPYKLTYDDSANVRFIQEINMVSPTVVKAWIYWRDAEDVDHIRPEKVTLELLMSQNTVNSEGKTVTEWVPVTDSDGTPVTAEATDWVKNMTGQGVKTVYFFTDIMEGQTYRVRVKTENRMDNLVRFPEKNSLYAETYTDGSSPSVALTAKKEYKVQKKWDVDLEGLDVPSSLTVILQKQNGESWGDPVQVLVLNAEDGWKGTFKPVDRYNYTKNGEYYYWNGEAVYRVRECKPAPLKGKLSEFLSGMEESAIKELGLPGFITDFVKGLLPNNNKVEKQVYDWICSQTEDTPFSSSIKKLLKDSVPENGQYITLEVPTYLSLISGEAVEAHNTKYRVKYSTSGNTTTITNLAVEDVTIWKLWVGIDEDDRPGNVYLGLTSRPDSKFAEHASSLGIPLVNDFTPVLNPIEADQITIPLIDWKIPLCITKVTKNGSKLSSYPWSARYVVKKYGELGLPQEFKGAEMASYILSEACKMLFGEFLGDFADIFDYAGINFLDEFISISTPAYRMPELISVIGSTLGYDHLEGLHSAVINTWIHGTPSIGGRKIWDDENDADGLRPSSVTIHIYEKSVLGKGKEIGTAKASRSSYWTWTYSDDNLDDSKEYLIEEEPVEGYTVSYDGYDIINTHKPTKPKTRDACEVTVQKNWNGAAPEEPLTVYLQNGSTVVAQTQLQAPEWRYTFTGLDLKDKNGKLISYSVSEAEVPGYKLDSVTQEKTERSEEVDGVTVNTTVYTFTLNNITTVEPDALFRVSKKWQNDQASQRPASVQMRVASADGTVDETLTLTAADGWTAETEVPMYDTDGIRMVYSLEELTSVDGYTSKVGSITSSISGTRTVYECTVTNTRGGDPDQLKARFVLNKVWQNVPNAQIPASVTFTVNGSNGDSHTLTLTAADGWTAALEDLPYADETGAAIVWSVEEKAAKGFLTSVGEVTSETSGNVVTYRCTVTNTVDPVPEEAKAEFIATKKWVDGLTDAERPNEVILTLTGSDGTKRVTHLNAADGWTHTFRGLDYTDSKGVRVTYTLSEEVPDRYTCEIGEVTREQNGGTVTYRCTVSNTLQESKARFKVTKLWKGDTYANRPGELTVYLLANGVVKSTHTLTEAEDWTYTWTDLPITDDSGAEIAYTVQEKEVSGYVLTVGAVEKEVQTGGHILYSCTLTNTLSAQPDPLTIRVVKKWMGDTEADRPATLSMQLTAGTLTTGIVLDGSETDTEGSWVKTLYNQPRINENGGTLNWQLTETVPEGYVCDIRKTNVSDSEILFTVTNTAKTVSMDLLVIKEWEDEGNEDLEMPVRLDILRDGEKTGYSVDLNQDNDYRQTVRNVPRYREDGTPYLYTVSEYDDPDDIWRFSQTSSRQGTTLVITGKNTLLYSGERAKVRVTKVWNEADGETPKHDSVTLLLHQNGNPWEYKLLKPDDGGGWTDEWFVPYADDDGNAIAYSVTEDVPDGYTCEISDRKTTTEDDITVYSFTVTNTAKYYTVTYDLTGDSAYGVPEGLTAPVDSKHYQPGGTVKVAPRQTTSWTTSDGTQSGVPGTWTFTGWARSGVSSASEDSFVINEDTLLQGKWRFTPREDPYSYTFVFYKEWIGGDDEHGEPVFILYRSDGTVERGSGSRPKKTGDGEYTYWLPKEDEYYVIEQPMDGYTTSYRNTGSDADDRAYYGGTVVNVFIPRTGDRTPLIHILLLLLLSVTGAVLLPGAMRKRKHGQ